MSRDEGSYTSCSTSLTDLLLSAATTDVSTPGGELTVRERQQSVVETSLTASKKFWLSVIP